MDEADAVARVSELDELAAGGTRHAEQAGVASAVVAIGRNEGARLMACLESLAASGVPAVYVDSGSSDTSVTLARERGIDVHELSSDRPFSAARARNEGYEWLVNAVGPVRYVQFLDADCVLADGWLAAAVEHLDAEPSCAAVIGNLSEREPERNVYHRLCAMEWHGPPGDLADCGGFGGISMVRSSAFVGVGRFDVSMIAGEDSEMAARLLLAGHRVTKIDHHMAIHDAAIARFSQYWKRAVRGGHAAAQRASRHGRSPLKDAVRDVRSIVFWGMALPVGAVALAPFTKGLSLVPVIAGYGLLFGRMIRYRRSLGDDTRNASIYAAAMIIAKFAQAIGVATFLVRARRNEYRIIEYK